MICFFLRLIPSKTSSFYAFIIIGECFDCTWGQSWSVKLPETIALYLLKECCHKRSQDFTQKRNTKNNSTSTTAAAAATATVLLLLLPLRQLLPQLLKQTANQTANQPNKWPINQTTNSPTNRPTKQPCNQTNNKTTKQPNNKTIKQPNNTGSNNNPHYNHHHNSWKTSSLSFFHLELSNLSSSATPNTTRSQPGKLPTTPRIWWTRICLRSPQTIRNINDNHKTPFLVKPCFLKEKVTRKAKPNEFTKLHPSTRLARLALWSDRHWPTFGPAKQTRTRRQGIHHWAFSSKENGYPKKSYCYKEKWRIHCGP